jgi:molybdate transport system permease protein
MKNRVRPLLLIGLAGGAFMLMILPVLALAIRAIRESAWQASTGEPLIDALWLSLYTSLISLTIICITGTPLAYGLAKTAFRGRLWVNGLVELPIVMPPAVAGLGLLLAFGRRGILGEPLNDLGINLPFTTAAVIIAQTFVALPFYVRSAQLGFRNIPTYLEEAARVDGADGWRIFWYISLPLAARSMLAGILLSWARAIGEFGATILFAGSLQGRTQTMTILVYNILERDLNTAIWAALILIGVALVTMLLTHLLLHEDRLLESD